jgi:hypothetical protein
MLVRARAALVGGVQLHVVHDFNEGRNGRASAGCTAGRRGDGDGSLNVGRAARAALALFELAGGLLALEFALGLGAVGGLEALVLADEFLANRAALGFGGSASGVAASRLADGLALGAVFLLALVLGAADGADRLLAVDSALSAGNFLALHLALGSLAHGVAHSRAGGVITLPLAGGVALLRADGDGEQADSQGYEEARHF